MVSTKMNESETTVLPAVVGGLVTVLLEVRDSNWRELNRWVHAIISGLISFSTAYYLVPAVLAYLNHKYNSQLIEDINVVSLAGFIGGLLGGKIINLTIYLFDRYSKNVADRAANKFLGNNFKNEPRDKKKK